MKKDVIYVDIEDDITSIIDKVKGAEAPIIALVPPKRIGVLQSIVNLKLLQRAAKSVDKRVVLITNDQALSSLAAGVSIPVAKNLQSKPEVPEITALDIDDDDVINGEELPVGDHASTVPAGEAASGITLPIPPKTPPMKASTAAMAAKNAPKKGGPKVPNFDIFRKKILLIAGGAVLLIVFLVWAIFFAAQATVTISAKTNLVNINQQLTLVPNGTLDASQKSLPAIVEQTKKTNSVDFDATGKKEIGDKATGPVKFTNNTQGSITVAAGTRLTSSTGLVYITNDAVTIPGGTISCNPFPNCQGVPGSANGVATAEQPGTKYNAATGAVTGSPSGVTAGFAAPTAGGTDKTATVVAQADIDKAKEQLAAQDAEKIKADLKKEFDGDVIIIDESFKVDPGEVASAPKVDEQATRAKLTSETTYTLIAVKRSDLKSVFNTYLKTQLSSVDDQKIYADGDEVAKFSQFQAIAANYKVSVQADGQVGPKIDEATLKPQLTGKRAGEIQQIIEDIQGVEKVETKFSPFWVTTAPDAKKITIKFTLKNDTN